MNEKTANTLISEFWLYRSHVFVRGASELEGLDPVVRIGALDIPLVRQPDASKLSHLTGRFAAPVPSTDSVKSDLNRLTDWALPNSNTFQVCFADPATPVAARICEPIVVEGNHGRMALRARLAVHRAVADLWLVLRRPDGTEVFRGSVAFDKDYNGGTNLEKYKSVSIELPAFDGELLAEIVADYKGTLEPANQHPPYVFVADPRIGALDMDQLARPLILTLGPAARSVWYSAHLGPKMFGGGDVVCVVHRQGEVPLHLADPVSVTLHRNHGQVLDFKASRAGQFVLYVDGHPAVAVKLGGEDGSVRLPAACLTGASALVELRDQTGTLVVWQDWLVLPRLLTPVELVQREGRSPYPVGIFLQSELRFRALRRHIAANVDGAELRQLERAIATLEAGPDQVIPAPLAFPQPAVPDISVVIPAHNNFNVTYTCLCALLLAWNRHSFEVVLVDDGSTDETQTIEALVSGITVVRHSQAQRFIKACNAGVARARGKYVVLLNNDTEPTVGWLDALVDGFERFDNVGLAGSKLLYPDGRLQEAGGVVWNSGNPWNYGHGQNPWDPRFSYARQVDYLSGASLMTTKAAWDEVGGFSEYLEPMYFEDTDIAFKMHRAGYATWFVPSSVVYHYEGVTSGTDTTVGLKRYQEVNRPKFRRQWVKDYAGFGKEGQAVDLEKDRNILGRVLFIDYQIPAPNQDAGGYAAVREMELVQSLGYKVTFLPVNLADTGTNKTELEKIGVEVITAPFFLSVDAFLKARGREFDICYITRYNVANKVLAPLRKLAPMAKLIMNNADLHFLRLLRAALTGESETMMDLARQTRTDELEAMNQVDLVLSYNEVEHAVIASHTDGAVKVMTCPWVVTCPDDVPPREGRSGLSFLGGFRHPPNVEAMEWFAREVMPKVVPARPDLVLSIYGSGLNDRIRDLRSENINPVGFIENPSVAYDRHMIFVAPLLSGAGIKGKVLSALSHGAPCVLTPVAAEGVGVRDGIECAIAQTAQDWAEAILRLLDDTAQWNKFSTNGRDLARTRYSFATAQNQMRAAFEAVGVFNTY